MGTTILDDIDEAFSTPRPARFVRDPDHCCECREHEETLSRVTPGTIGLAEAGHPGWDPFCFVTDEAFSYFMPGLCRLALGTGEDYYLWSLLFHLESGRADSFRPGQRLVVKKFLEYLYIELMPSEIDDNGDSDTLGRVCEQLSRPHAERGNA
jgi:hypothetical protein